MSFTLTANTKAFQEAFAAAKVAELVKLRNLLEMVGAETVAYLRSLTGEMRPPATKRGAPRPAHPGHWADVTGQLSLEYAYRVKPLADGARLTLSNSAEYAIYLEAHRGYFVLSGVTDPGGPLETELRRAVAVIAPDWTITSHPWAADSGFAVG